MVAVLEIGGSVLSGSHAYRRAAALEAAAHHHLPLVVRVLDADGATLIS